MTKTKFDRWLIENFVYEHHIRVVRCPDVLPSGVEVTELKTKNYHFLLTVKNKAKGEKLIQQLTDQGHMFSTKIAEVSHWYNYFIFQKNKSFSFSLFWWVSIAGGGIYLISKFRQFMETPFYHELCEEIKTLINI